MKKNDKIMIVVLCVILCLGISGYFINEHIQNSKEEEIPEETEEVEEEVIEKVEEEEEVVIPIDFAHWKGVNEDVYAWIEIADTNINYPILQSATDDSYYLEHTIEGVASLPGSIYTESRNAKDFSDFNTLIYGHNMKDGSMFKHLHKFKDSEFFESHDTVTIYTETEIKTYRVFAAVIYDNRHILLTYDNDSIEDRKEFIQSLYDMKSSTKLFREGMTIDENSRLITMSTCTGNSSTRLIVVAAEVVEE